MLLQKDFDQIKEWIEEELEDIEVAMGNLKQKLKNLEDEKKERNQDMTDLYKLQNQ